MDTIAARGEIATWRFKRAGYSQAIATNLHRFCLTCVLWKLLQRSSHPRFSLPTVFVLVCTPKKEIQVQSKFNSISRTWPAIYVASCHKWMPQSFLNSPLLARESTQETSLGEVRDTSGQITFGPLDTCEWPFPVIRDKTRKERFKNCTQKAQEAG